MVALASRPRRREPEPLPTARRAQSGNDPAATSSPWRNTAQADPRARTRPAASRAHRAGATGATRSSASRRNLGTRTASRRPATLRPTSPQPRIPLRLILGALVVVVLGIGLVNGASALIGLFSPAPAAEAPANTNDPSTDNDPSGATTSTDTTTASDPTAPTSTPKSKWQKGTVPELFQTDPAWASEPYAGGTIEKNGCGITCMAMVYIALTGKTDMGPVEMATFSEQNGYVEANSTSWRFMTDGGAQLGLTVETLPDVASRITGALEAGHPVIVNVEPGTFTTVGHYIVLVGVDADGRIRIHNPNAPEDNKVSWDLETIMHDARNYWAFSA